MFPLPAAEADVSWQLDLRLKETHLGNLTMFGLTGLTGFVVHRMAHALSLSGFLAGATALCLDLGLDNLGFLDLSGFSEASFALWRHCLKMPGLQRILILKCLGNLKQVDESSFLEESLACLLGNRATQTSQSL